LPPVNKLYTDLKDKGFQALLISFREPAELVRRTVRERGYIAPVLLDQNGKVTGEVYGVWGTPTAYFVDRRGQLIGRVVGPRSWDGAAARKLVLALIEADAKP
jgi:hypothetical protein